MYILTAIFSILYQYKYHAIKLYPKTFRWHKIPLTVMFGGWGGGVGGGVGGGGGWGVGGKKYILKRTITIMDAKVDTLCFIILYNF